MNRKLGINCDCIIESSPVTLLEKIKAAGFESFFVNMRDLETMKALQEKACELELDFAFIHAPFKNINAMWSEGEDYLGIYNRMVETIDAAAACGVPLVIAHVSSGWNAPEVNDLGLSRFDALVDHAEEKGVTVAFENLRMVGNLAYFADRYEKRESVKFCYDVGHEHCYTKTVCWPDIFTDRMAATHIHDNMGRGRERVGDPDSHLLPFDGTCDYVKMMRKLDEYEFTGPLMLEVLNHSVYQTMTPEEFLATCFERIEKISKL